MWKTKGVPLRSALQDFESTSLAAISGLLGKLHYLVMLQDGQGSYSHWGMERVHGEEAAHRAIRTSHATVVAQVLRTPLRTLVEDVRCSAASAQVSTRELLSSLKQMARQCLPERSAAIPHRHLMAVLHALSALVESQARASHPDASLRLPPVR
jgi:hypothetical protein